MNFVEAVKDLAGQYGMQVPEEDASPAERARAAEQRQKQATLTDVLEKAGAAYRKQLRHSPRAIDYLKGRGVSGEVAKQFGWAMPRKAGAAWPACSRLRRPAAGRERPGDRQRGAQRPTSATTASATA
jgi:DNA primase